MERTITVTGRTVEDKEFPILDEKWGAVEYVYKYDSRDGNRFPMNPKYWECILNVKYENLEDEITADINPMDVLWYGKCFGFDNTPESTMGFLCNKRLLATIVRFAADIKDIPLGERLQLPTEEEAERILEEYAVPLKPLRERGDIEEVWWQIWCDKGWVCRMRSLAYAIETSVPEKWKNDILETKVTSLEKYEEE